MDDLRSWKDNDQGTTAALIEGARRVGKTTVVEAFAKEQYRTSIILDFSKEPKSILDLFKDGSDLDKFFRTLQLLKQVTLYERESVIVFDEVQLFPLARQMIKQLVEDHRYDYIETGSLISLQKNVKNILECGLGNILVKMAVQHLLNYKGMWYLMMWTLGIMKKKQYFTILNYTQNLVKRLPLLEQLVQEKLQF